MCRGRMGGKSRSRQFSADVFWICSKWCSDIKWIPSNLVKWNLKQQKHGSLIGNPWWVYTMELVSSHLNFIKTKTMTTCLGSYEEPKPEAWGGFHWFPLVSRSLYIESRRTLFFSLPSSSSFFGCFHSKLLQLSNCFASQCVLISPLGFEPLWPLHAVQSSKIQENATFSMHWQSFAKVNITPLKNTSLPTNFFPTRQNQITKILSAHHKRVKFSWPKFHENRWRRSCSHCFTGLVPVHNILFIVFLHNKRICFQSISVNTSSYNCLWRSNMATHLPFPGSRLECSGFFAHFQRTVFNVLNMVKYGEIDAKIHGEIGEIRNWWNQLVGPAGSQVASTWPKVKQIGKNTSDPGETCPIILHKLITSRGVGHGQITQLFFGQPMWDLRVWGAAGRMDNVKAKALNIFNKSNTSRLLPKSQHERCVLCKA